MGPSERQGVGTCILSAVAPHFLVCAGRCVSNGVCTVALHRVAYASCLSRSVLPVCPNKLCLYWGFEMCSRDVEIMAGGLGYTPDTCPTSCTAQRSITSASGRWGKRPVPLTPSSGAPEAASHRSATLGACSSTRTGFGALAPISIFAPEPMSFSASIDGRKQMRSAFGECQGSSAPQERKQSGEGHPRHRVWLRVLGRGGGQTNHSASCSASWSHADVVRQRGTADRGIHKLGYHEATLTLATESRRFAACKKSSVPETHPGSWRTPASEKAPCEWCCGEGRASCGPDSSRAWATA